MAVPLGRAVSVGLVGFGGAVGTAAREALSLLVPARAGVPVVILAINVLGAFLLGVLLEALLRRGPDHGRRLAARLLLGTGVLGGFTTYSALATDTVLLARDGRVWVALSYALATLLVGAGATVAGILAGARVSSARPEVRR